MADHHHHQQQYHTSSPESSNQYDEESAGHGHGQDSALSLREQDRLLPIANVSRIMKRALPANAKMSKEAKETVQECVSEFISFITGEASDKCQREKRKTVNGDDLLWAMSTLGFEDYIEPLKLYLHKYRELEGERVSMVKQGEEAGYKEGHSGGMLGANGGLDGGSKLMTAYGHQPGSLKYGSQQILQPYSVLVPGSGIANSNKGHLQGN